jgi:outer membrane protein
MDEKAAPTAAKAAPSSKIAFVEVDSIMTQYSFCKEYSKILEQKGNNIQKTLASKQQQLQAAAANFQQKVQQNAYTREQAEACRPTAEAKQRLAGAQPAPQQRVPGRDREIKQSPARLAQHYLAII